MSTPPHHTCIFRRVLFCTDFSENADFAFDYALDAASRSPDAVLHLLHVIPEPDAQFWKSYLYEVENLDEKARQDMDAKLTETYLHRVPAGIRLEVSMRIGKDYLKILEYAEEINADLIVMGRQGSSSLGTVLFGNVTERVARRAGCPVLIIPFSYERKLSVGE